MPILGLSLHPNLEKRMLRKLALSTAVFAVFGVVWVANASAGLSAIHI
jgi:hypothetical protein